MNLSQINNISRFSKNLNLFLATKISMLEFLGPRDIKIEDLKQGLQGLENTLNAIEEITANEETIFRTSMLKSEEIAISGKLRDLRELIYLKSTSGKRLEGNCHYLG